MSAQCREWHSIMLIISVNRYYEQEFAYITKQSLKELVKMKKCEMTVFEAAVLESCVFKRKLMVPLLVQGSLRIKLINKEVLDKLRKMIVEEGQRGDDSKEVDFFEATFENKDYSYIFGKEPESLDSTLAYGRLVSLWGLDPLVTEPRLSYNFARFLLCVFGTGYGGRDIAECIGLNLYFKHLGRGTSRPFATPAVAEEEIALHQYRNNSQRYDLMNPFYRKTVNDLTRNMGRFAKKHNCSLMRLVGDACSRMIVTTGNIPRPKDVAEGGGKIVKEVPNKDSTHTCTYSITPTTSFGSASHCDSKDNLWQSDRNQWLDRATTNGWKHCVKLLHADTDDFCLPTTIGYQFCFHDREIPTDFAISAFFSMEGLGLAMQIDDGVGHHFMGSVFSHHSCLTLHSKEGQVSCCNDEDAFLLVAFGTSGGGREAKDKIKVDHVHGKNLRKELPVGHHVKATRQRGKKKQKQSSLCVEKDTGKSLY